ncbi:hypothetical protein Q427_26865 [Halomonas sp. BC04]|nr:hypothetical protein Q427_26865 [Halomonas sp. BC04]
MERCSASRLAPSGASAEATTRPRRLPSLPIHLPLIGDMNIEV